MSEEVIRKRREREHKNSQADQERAPSRSGLTSTLSSALEWYNQSAHSYTTLTLAREPGIWGYHATADERDGAPSFATYGRQDQIWRRLFGVSRCAFLFLV
ncbi:hypothetical protein SCLCIDRAFT_27492 [Scleroderma citrinum Foug A]|uniref:Uncharacterized protein n=1 Tax=Scleroderma citrinum Foug A TaxID=1036808 RepID=A0A0C2ZBM6_9AGAM|nr:hypothetical protein SCLCIDRAFT_27492 [Scleroderma citrinum Foug A]